MDSTFQDSFTAFDGDRRIAAGPLLQVALIVKQTIERAASGPVLIFDDATGRSIDIDTRGSEEDLAARFARSEATDVEPAASMQSAVSRGRGRPKLGVVAREVTLLPRHWEWLSTQPGGASVALRKLVEEARRANAQKDSIRRAHERAYHFMSAMAGDLPGFEEATRALFANDRSRFGEIIARWPQDIRDHSMALGFSGMSQATAFTNEQQRSAQ